MLNMIDVSAPLAVASGFPALKRMSVLSCSSMPKSGGVPCLKQGI